MKSNPAINSAPNKAFLWILSIALLAALIPALSTSLSNSSLHQSLNPGNGHSDSDVDRQLDVANGEDDVNSTAESCRCEDGSAGADDGGHRRSVAATLGLFGPVADCCCSFEAVERANFEEIHPLLRRVVATPFFAHFKVDLCSDCALWRDAPMCVLRDCGVCECERPPEWAEDVDWMPREAMGGADDDDDCGHVDDRVVTIIDSQVTDGWTAAAPTAPLFFDEPAPSTMEKDDTAIVVDLRLNPERYTGYAGRSAEKVWAAVHRENCFQQNEVDGEDGRCLLTTDQRVYNRIISGMHSSISLHIAHSYCLEMDPEHIAECRTWGTNATLAYERVLSHKDRLENLYVVFAVTLRAVQMAGPAITAAVPTEDPYFADSLSEWTDRLRPEIAETFGSCPPTFDETGLFSETSDAGDAESRRLELKRRFRHLLQIMECVGCDRCKLWGTLQTLGVGTALRILLEEGESRDVDLSRQEAVALVHTLERFSSALVYAHGLQKADEDESVPA